MPQLPRKLVIADAFPASGVARLKGLNFQVAQVENAAALPTALQGAAVLIVRSTKVNAAAIGGARELQLIVRAGAGVDNIDVAQASALGVYVANCPGKNAAAVAELALGLLLAADRRIPEATTDLRAGRWNKKEFAKARGLLGRTLGVLGVGRIGELVIARARGFGMRVLACSRSLTPERAAELGAEFCPDLYRLAQESDAVTVHLAFNAETHHLVDERFFREMKPGAILVNTSRGEVVDTAALERAAREKGIRAALDVFEGEPAAGAAPFASPLCAQPGFCGTPHIGASTDQAQEAIAEEAVRIVDEFTRTGQVPHCVNLARRTPAQWLLVVRHLDRVGVLAGVFERLRAARINVQQTSNTVFQGAEAAIARIELDSAPPELELAALRGQEHVLGIEILPLGTG